MNMTTIMQAAQAMQNPQAYVMQTFTNRLIAEHPREWQQCQQMFANKSQKQQVVELRKLYKQKGMDLDTIAKQYGIAL